jgi:hypothetical protein
MNKNKVLVVSSVACLALASFSIAISTWPLVTVGLCLFVASHLFKNDEYTEE